MCPVTDPSAPTTGEPADHGEAHQVGYPARPVARIRLTGFAGSILLLVGSLGSGALPVYDPVARIPVLGALRRGAGPDVALGCVYAGLAVLALAWLYLGRALRRGVEGTAVGDLVRTAVLWGAPLLLAAPLFSRDMYSYAAQAQLTHLGLDPYSNGPAAVPGPFLDEVQRMWVDTPAPYGPLWLMLGSLVAAVTGHHVMLTVLAMRLLAVGGAVLVACFLPRLAVRFGADPRVALWLAVLNPLLLIHFVAGGHNDALMLGLILAGLWIAVTAASEGRLALGVVVITLAVLIKAPAAIAVGFLVPIWASRIDRSHPRLRATAMVAVVGLGTFAAVTVASGLGIGWIRQLNTPGAVVNWLSVPTGLAMLVNGLRQLFGLAGDSQTIIETFRAAAKVVSVVAVLAIWARSFRSLPVRSLAAALAVVIMLSPVVQPWYLLWPLALAAVTPLPERARIVAAGVSVFLSLLITPQGATLFNLAAPVLTTGLAVIVATYVILARTDERGSPDAPANATAGRRESGPPESPAASRVPD